MFAIHTFHVVGQEWYIPDPDPTFKFQVIPVPDPAPHTTQKNEGTKKSVRDLDAAKLYYQSNN
jgi:hypothetical protein